MSVERCMSEVGCREFLVWMHLRKREMETPSRTDHYIMRNSLEVRRLYYATVKKRKTLKLDDFKLTFSSKRDIVPGRDDYTEEEIKEISRRARAIHMKRHSGDGDNR